MNTVSQVTVLLVEDDPVLAILEKMKLNKEGYEVLHVHDGESSIEIIRSGKIRVDIVLMDINLGSGIDGTQAAAEILKYVEVPVLFLSSHTEKEVLDKTETITSYGYVVKNSGDLVLFASIKMALKLFQAKQREKKANEALRLKDSFISAVLDNLPIGIAVNSVEPTVDFSYMNDNFVKIYRTSRESLHAPDSFWSAVYREPAFREALKKRVIEDCLSGNADQMIWENIPIQREGEETTYICARNLPLPEKGIMVSLVWDVTLKKKIEDGLKESEEKLRNLVENQRELLINFDLKRRILYANSAYCRLFDVSKPRIISNLFDPRIHPDDSAIVNEAEKMLSLPPYRTEYEARFFTKYGWRRLSWYFNGIPKDDGTVVSFIGTGRDTTERKT